MDDIISLAYGNGGENTRKLIDEILGMVGNDILNEQLDAAVLPISGKIAFTTDSFIVSPIFFSGGDIGELSVYGTVNDLSVVGATPLYLSLSFIIEEGFSFSAFRNVLLSIKRGAETANVKIVTGDTKVVEKGKGDGIFINTSGVGVIENGRDWRKREIKDGDLIIINGGIGEHGISVMLERLGIKVGKSDMAPLNSLVLPLLDKTDGIKFMRDPTRGGVATVLNEISAKYGVGIEIYEDKLPLKQWVKDSSEILGIDPLYAANEGKVVMVVSDKDADFVLNYLHDKPGGSDASIIGKVTKSADRVYLVTRIGTKRILDTLKADILPRIC